ncbi:Tn3 family transposase [bacterium]|nr:Tn3 family transposase [bacterium]MDB4566752.1 Tn3 family transposase [Akkermansiaceae bacterium]MDB4572814.1 Tn3 family transposase [Akkermansiaceae bacterium]
MNILSAREQEAHDAPPRFSGVERKSYFSLPVEIRKLVENLRTPTNQVGFALAYGYFRATKSFFAECPRERDVEYVCIQLQVPISSVQFEEYAKGTIVRNRQRILEYFGFSDFDHSARMRLQKEIEDMVRSQLKPRLIFHRSVDILIEQKIALPSSDALSKLILEVLNGHRKKLVRVIDQNLAPETRALLDQLLEKAPDVGDRDGSRFQLTLLKKCSQSTRPGKIRESVDALQLIGHLQQQIRPLLKQLDLPHGGISYFANSVLRSRTFDVTRRGEEDRYLHLIAFITHQYFLLQDTLVDVFLATVQSASGAATREHKERCYEQRSARGEAVALLMAELDKSFKVIDSLDTFARDPELDDASKLTEIRSLLQQRREAQTEALSTKQQLENQLTDVPYLDFLEKRSLQIQARASPILKALQFNAQHNGKALAEALSHFRERDGNLDEKASSDFLSPAERDAVFEAGEFRVSLYKVLLFMHVRKGLKAGMLNLEHSYKYRTLEDYLISISLWERDKDTLLERAGLLEFRDSKKVLDALDNALFEQYVETNSRLQEGSNKQVRFTPSGSLRVTTPKLSETDADPLQALFPDRQYISLCEVLATVDHHSQFLEKFQHWQQRYNRTRPTKGTFIAAISALGCDIGTGKILQISREINSSELENTVNWYFHPEGLQRANDRLLAFMDRLELAQVYRRSQDQLHTSSDGQQFEVRGESLNANYSHKYSRKTKASNVHSFIDERHLLFHSLVVSAAERESAWVIDGLMHNDVIQSDIHSTDTHGYTEAIFGVMHLLGISYAPRIKNFKDQKIYLFKSRQEVDRSSWKVTPDGYINRELIEAHWDDILRFVATIKLKKTSASDLFRRLNSYSKNHALYTAFKGFGRILKSIFILRYIDDLELRQSIEKQLNKVESSNRFSREVSVGNGREILQSDRQEQEVAQSCKRLVKNAIVCWNYLYLTQKIAEESDPERKEGMLRSVAAGSVVSWRHINLLGEYDFSEEKLRDSFGIKPPEKNRISGT